MKSAVCAFENVYIGICIGTERGRKDPAMTETETKSEERHAML